MLVQSTGDERSGQKKRSPPSNFLTFFLSSMHFLYLQIWWPVFRFKQLLHVSQLIFVRHGSQTPHRRRFFRPFCPALSAPCSSLDSGRTGLLLDSGFIVLFANPVAPTATKTSRASQTSSLMPFSRRRHQRTITGLGSFTTLITRTSGFIETTLKTRIFFEAFDCEPFET